ncbi:hypothetical protein Tsubulata_041745 [Turnera subulata]|uniref:CCHC-type domain-containing protein n=1 Tax=Turnera subulata TaxID=218843 RepID=A0A9Q0FCN7_9ROSI|nr:hypothetical protein Tsubulata_041745 [Turnera subulata]
MASPPLAGSGYGQPATPNPCLSHASDSPNSYPPDVAMNIAVPSPAMTSSFKEKLVAGKSASTTIADDFVEQDDDIVAYQTPKGPVVKLSDRYRSMLHKRWANTLIVKLWGRTIGFKSLCSKLPHLWSLKEGVRVVDLEKNFYFVRFNNRQDYMHALTDGPWIVFGHCLTVEPWIPQFNPATQKIKSVVAWVQIPELSCEYYDRRLLHTVCNMIGRLVRIDYNTEEAIRGRYARVALELDLEKPLQSQVFVDSKWFHISYENIPQICFSCGHAGHLMANCPVEGSIPVVDVAVDEALNQAPAVAPTTASTSMAQQPRGEWMVAAPRQRRPPRNGIMQQRKEGAPGKESAPPKGFNEGSRSGSRFDILTDYMPVNRPFPLIKEPLQPPSLVTSKEKIVNGVISGIASSLGDQGITAPLIPTISPLSLLSNSKSTSDQAINAPLIPNISPLSLPKSSSDQGINAPLIPKISPLSLPSNSKSKSTSTPTTTSTPNPHLQSLPLSSQLISATNLASHQVTTSKSDTTLPPFKSSASDIHARLDASSTLSKQDKDKKDIGDDQSTASRAPSTFLTALTTDTNDTLVSSP